MKKEFKGKPNKLLEEVEDWVQNLDEKEINKNYKLVVGDIRSLDSNSYLHKILRVIGEHIGEEDIEQLKKDIKLALNYYRDEVVETTDASYITRIYEKTSEMTSKDLTMFLQKVEVWALNQFGLSFEHLKKEVKDGKF